MKKTAHHFPKILLADDEKAIAETITAYALKQNLEIVYAPDGEKALEEFNKQKFDLIILDWMMPQLSGPEVLKIVRGKNSKVPILMLTARDDESDIVMGLDLGADDYLTKPFGPRELMARIKSLLRRSSPPKTEKNLKLGDLEFKFDCGEILRKGKEIKLTPNEMRILKLLVEKRGTVISREELMEKALGYQDFLNDRTLDTHIKNLRQKLEKDPRDPKIILTIRELGFKMAGS